MTALFKLDRGLQRLAADWTLVDVGQLVIADGCCCCCCARDAAAACSGWIRRRPVDSRRHTQQIYRLFILSMACYANARVVQWYMKYTLVSRPRHSGFNARYKMCAQLHHSSLCSLICVYSCFQRAAALTAAVCKPGVRCLVGCIICFSVIKLVICTMIYCYFVILKKIMHLFIFII